jgi:hypothetical protein
MGNFRTRKKFFVKKMCGITRALPYANADCPYGAILMNIYCETKTEFSSVRCILQTKISKQTLTLNTIVIPANSTAPANNTAAASKYHGKRCFVLGEKFLKTVLRY